MSELSYDAGEIPYEDIFDFAFSDDELDESGDTSPTTISQEDGLMRSARLTRKFQNKKSCIVSAKSARRSQFMNKVSKGKASTIAHLGTCDIKPNVSKRNPSNILYAFPNFDKSDALLYFPNTLSRLMNSGDLCALKKLLLSHVDKNCEVTVHQSIPRMNARSLLTMTSIMHDLRPDLIMCVASTKVVENQIRASAYIKFTDVRSVYDSVVDSISEPIFQAMFTKKRTQRFSKSLECGLEHRTEEEQRVLLNVVDSEADLLLYGAVDITLTYDDITKKIKHLGFETRLTSIHPAVSCPDLD